MEYSKELDDGSTNIYISYRKREVRSKEKESSTSPINFDNVLSKRSKSDCFDSKIHELCDKNPDYFTCP